MEGTQYRRGLCSGGCESSTDSMRRIVLLLLLPPPRLGFLGLHILAIYIYGCLHSNSEGICSFANFECRWKVLEAREYSALISYIYNAAEESKTNKVFVQHVETVSSFDTTVDVVKSFVVCMAVPC